jgi:hypothetical protein
MQLITAIVAPSRIDAVLRGLLRFGLCGWNLSRAYVVDRGPDTFVRLDLVAANADATDVVRVIAGRRAGHAERVGHATRSHGPNQHRRARAGCRAVTRERRHAAGPPT